jgi:large subunit ribosomal protein L30
VNSVVTEKAPRTILIKWVRSGIGFGYRQKEMVRSLGLRRLNQVVERPDTPQIRGLVARIPHLVEVVPEPPKVTAWGLMPEYTLRPPEVAPLQSPAAPEAVPGHAEPEAVVPSETREPVLASTPAEAAAEAERERPAPAKAAKSKKPAKQAATRKAKAPKTEKTKPGAGKSAKPSKARKK